MTSSTPAQPGAGGHLMPGTPWQPPAHAIQIGPQAPQSDSYVPLRSPAALEALFRLVGNHDEVHELASRYASWERLACAPYQELATVLGAKAAALRIPAALPAAPMLPDGVRRISRYAFDYPTALREIPAAPVVLYLRGELPAGPAVAVAGAEHPSPQGVEIARSAALAAVAHRLPVIVQLSDGIGVTALRAALAAGGRAVVVVPHGLDQLSKHATLLQDTIDAGGAVVSEAPAGYRISGQLTISAARLVTALAHTIVLAEVGRHATAGASAATAAVASGKYLIVPTPQQHYIPETALGLRVLAETRAFSDAWYGSSPRLRARVENGLSPADAVVSSQEQIAAAIRISCRGLGH